MPVAPPEDQVLARPPPGVLIGEAAQGFCPGVGVGTARLHPAYTGTRRGWSQIDPISVGLLAVALGLDSLMVGLLYGMRRIRLSWGAMGIVACATGLLLMLSMAAGRLIAAALPPGLAGRAGAVLLAGVGIWITYQTLGAQGRAGPRERPARKPLRVVAILREPAAADLDQSGHISPTEALLLGVALALDATAAGLGAAMTGLSPLGLPAAAAAATWALLYAGSRWARLLPFTLEGRWAAIHGVVLLAVGLYRMTR